MALCNPTSKALMSGGLVIAGDKLMDDRIQITNMDELKRGALQGILSLYGSSLEGLARQYLPTDVQAVTYLKPAVIAAAFTLVTGYVIPDNRRSRSMLQNFATSGVAEMLSSTPCNISNGTPVLGGGVLPPAPSGSAYY